MTNIPRLELPSGGWIEFNDPNMSIRARDVRELAKVADGDGLFPAASIFAAVDYLAARLITAWNLPYANVPYTAPNAIDELTAQDFGAYVNAVAPAMLAAVAGRAYEPPAAEDAVAVDVTEGEEMPATA